MREVSFLEEKRKSLSPEAEAHLGHTGQQCCDLDKLRDKTSQPILSWGGIV